MFLLPVLRMIADQLMPMMADQRVEVLETETVGYLRSHAISGFD
jgi:hypothetical protein